MATVAKAWIEQIIATAERCGVNRQQLLAAAAIRPVSIGKQERYALDDVVKLWGCAIELSQDPYFGLHMGEQLTPGRLNLISHLIMGSSSVDEALHKARRFQRLVSDGGTIDILNEGDSSWIIYQPQPQTLPFNRHQIEAALATILNVMRWGLGASFSPRQVCLQHPEPTLTEEHRRVFHCLPRFNAEYNAIGVDTALLEQHYDNDTSLAALHEQMAERLLQALDTTSWTEQVRSLLECNLASGDTSREGVARALHMSPKTLQRRLAEEGQSFQEVLDQLRRELALLYLQQSELALEDISGLLGFTEPSAFYRAFKRWTGTTPSQLREQLTRPSES